MLSCLGAVYMHRGYMGGAARARKRWAMGGATKHFHLEPTISKCGNYDSSWLAASSTQSPSPQATPTLLPTDSTSPSMKNEDRSARPSSGSSSVSLRAARAGKKPSHASTPRARTLRTCNRADWPWRSPTATWTSLTDSPTRVPTP